MFDFHIIWKNFHTDDENSILIQRIITAIRRRCADQRNMRREQFIDLYNNTFTVFPNARMGKDITNGSKLFRRTDS